MPILSPIHVPSSSLFYTCSVPRTRKDYIAPVDEKTIGARIRAFRLQRGMTQVELAAELGITQSAVSDYEKGAVRVHAALVAALAKALRASADEILGHQKPSPNGHTKDRRFVRRLEKLDRLSKRDRQTLLGTIDAFLSKLPD
jgi:transcriptional regulator with XRE-family HTH domain